MENSNVEQFVKSSKRIKDKARSFLREKDRVRDSYRKHVIAYRSLELINDRLNGSSYVAKEEEKQAAINPHVKSEAQLRKEANAARELCFEMLAEEMINLKMLYQQIEEDIQIRNELTEEEIKSEWNRERDRLMAMDNLKLQAERQKIEDSVREANEQKAKEDVEKIKEQRTELLKMIAMLDASIKIREENINRLEGENANRRIRIEELEVNIARRYRELSSNIELAFGAMADDKKFTLELNRPSADMLESLNIHGDVFEKEWTLNKNDIFKLLENHIRQNIEHRSDDPMDVEISDIVIQQLLNELRSKYNYLDSEMLEKFLANEMNSGDLQNKVHKIAEELKEQLAGNEHFQSCIDLADIIKKEKVELGETKAVYEQVEEIIHEEKMKVGEEREQRDGLQEKVEELSEDKSVREDSSNFELIREELGKFKKGSVKKVLDEIAMDFDDDSDDLSSDQTYVDQNNDVKQHSDHKQNQSTSFFSKGMNSNKTMSTDLKSEEKVHKHASERPSLDRPVRHDDRSYKKQKSATQNSDNPKQNFRNKI